MGRVKPKGGGGGTVDWVALAEHNPIVVLRHQGRLEDFQGRGGATPQVKLDMLVLSGPQAGRVVDGEKVIGKGITNEMTKHAQGDDVPVRLSVLNSAGNDYCATQVPSAPEMELVDRLFPEGQEDDVWAKARASWAEKSKAAPALADDVRAGAAPKAAPSPAGADAPW